MSENGGERGASSSPDDGPEGRPDGRADRDGAAARRASEAELRAELYDDAPPITLTPNQAKRVSSTARGMLIATGATLAVVLPVYFLNPSRTADSYERDIDVPSIALEAQDDAGYRPAAPDLPEDWSSNYARWNSGLSSGVAFWEVGYLTADDGFIQLTQTDEANPTWVSQRLGAAQVSGARTVADVDWELLDAPNGDTVLTSEVEGTTVILDGPAGLDEFDVMGEAVVAKIRENAADPSAPDESSTGTDGTDRG